ncbi:MAG TPA: ABC transporter permease [Thermoanaerobaculia bacterium]|nr:ABC transporter permease [Thermoanaerobaculia bacterium]
MRGGDLLAFAAGAFRGHKLRASLSLLGVAIGVAAVILLTSLGEGARRYVTGEFALLGSNLVIVLPGKAETTGVVPVGGVPHDLTLEDVEALRRRVSLLATVAPLSVGGLTARFGERSRDLTVAGVTSEWKEVRRLALREGAFLPPGDPDRAPRVCVVGAKVASELFPGRSPVGELLRLGEERFRVTGVLVPRGVSVGLDLDEVVLVPIGHHLRMFDRRSVFRVLCEARTSEDLEAAKAGILAVLKDRHDGEEDVTVLTQDAVMKTFGKVLGILTAALAGIAAVSLTVAGVGIMNVMLVSVSERTREVGLLKALGASASQVLRLFLVEAAILSTAGGVLGLLAGGLGTLAIRALYPDFPVVPPAWAVAAALAVSVSVGLVFGVLPARRAARLDPVVALARR